jgi:glucose/arabinose dehydrogenase
MQRAWQLVLAWMALVPVLAVSAAAASPEFELRDGDRVVFLGDTLFEREGVYGQFEKHLTTAFPDRRVTYRNLSWAGDTPSGRARASFDWNKSEADWLKRVKEQLAIVKPTVAFLSYGQTAVLEGGIAGLPKFREDLGKLMDAVEEVAGEKVRFVILGPLRVEAPAKAADARERAKAQESCDAQLAELARGRGAAFVSLLAPELAGAVAASELRESGGVVPNERGFDRLGAALVAQLTGKAAVTGDSAEAGEVLRTAIREKNDQFFHRWRPENWTYLFGFRKHEQGRNAVEIPKFDPIVEEWDQRIVRLRNLKQQDPATVSLVRSVVEAREVKRRGTPSGAARAGGSVGAGQASGTPQPVPTFTVAEGFEVSLFAENPMLFKPIQMNWDPQGRLWVASSRVYPQIRPGQEAEDSVIVLEDTDGDGVAEKSTVFADGLLIPTSVVPDGKGGCYVGASHQLLHFEDTDGDGRSDRRTVTLSSFGTEDTHHNLHTLRWGYDGHLYMNQSIYTHTPVETPFGVRRLNSAGIWRFNPETWQFEIFTRGGCNPWGHHWDQFGNHFFTDGAGFKGIYHAMEGATYFTYSDMRREAESISPGNYPKFCSLEVVHSPAFPADWQGQVVTCDFRAHRVVRFGLQDVGSSFRTVEMPDLARSTNVTFRPIDLRFGPDGALYIADWSNPIIQHGEVDFRDPRRDKEHGRIWRVAMKGGAGDRSRRDLTKLGTPELLSLTLSKNGWDQEQARLVLRNRGAGAVLPASLAWLGQQKDPRAKLEVMWLHEAFEKPAPGMVKELAGSADERLRTAAARQLAR